MQQLHNAVGWSEVLEEWPLTPVSDAVVLLAAAAYVGAVRRRAYEHDARWPRWRTTYFLGGLAMIVLALNSAIGVHAVESHSVHMVHHLLLITVAPALLSLGHR